MKKIRIGVIGSGVSGLSCAWLLSQRHDVTLIEAEPRLGGHSNTVDVTVGGQHSAVDTGFIVCNTWTYPNFSALMDYLDVAMVDTQMTFSVSAEEGRYEYAGDHLGTLLGTARQWLSPRHWRLMADLVRFYRTAEARAPAVPPHITLGQYLKREGYGEGFVRRHILPIAAAIWSIPPQAIADYPFRAFVDFFANHGLFELGKRPDWRTVAGGSREYVRKLVADSRYTQKLSAPVSAIKRHRHGVDVMLARGGHETFEHVVLATHADQALALLADPSGAENNLLSQFKTSANHVYLHRDASLMPRTRRFWSAWNYQDTGNEAAPRLAVTYWMNALQRLETPVEHFVSLNPARLPEPGLVDGRFHYRHPVFNVETRLSQPELWDLQGTNRTWFCGAWFGAGFHEDGIQAGLAVAEQLGGLSRPWVVANPSGRIHVRAHVPPADFPIVEAAE